MFEKTKICNTKKSIENTIENTSCWKYVKSYSILKKVFEYIYSNTLQDFQVLSVIQEKRVPDLYEKLFLTKEMLGSESILLRIVFMS